FDQAGADARAAYIDSQHLREAMQVFFLDEAKSPKQCRFIRVLVYRHEIDGDPLEAQDGGGSANGDLAYAAVAQAAADRDASDLGPVLVSQAVGTHDARQTLRKLFHRRKHHASREHVTCVPCGVDIVEGQVLR